MGDVCVVVTTYNHAHYLDDALRSVAGQTLPAAQVVVIDDGSTDDPAAVVANWPFAELIRQENQGLSAARNRGLRATRTPFVVFLDADDLLEPVALEQNVSCALDNRRAAFVWGAHRRADAQGTPVGEVVFHQAYKDAVGTFLRGNVVGMHATVLYRSSALRAVGGFDERLRTCEDYDVYLRLVQHQGVASHPCPVARYRRHPLNMSHDHLQMLQGALGVQGRYRPGPSGPLRRRWAYRRGVHNWRNHYALVAYTEVREQGGSIADGMAEMARFSPSPSLGWSVAHKAVATYARRAAQVLMRVARRSDLARAGARRSRALRQAWRSGP